MAPRLSWVIGSGGDCDVVVNDSAVSRRHCQLALTAEGYRLEDLGSTNRTYVNGQPIGSEVAVKRGDKITLGQNLPLPWPKLGLPRRTFSIGRARGNDIVLDFDNVSSRHANLITDGETITIEDLNSTNGIFIGEPPRRTARAVVGADETIRFGSFAAPVAQLLHSALNPQPAGGAMGGVKVRSESKAFDSGQRSNIETGPNWQASAPAWVCGIAAAVVGGLLVWALLGRRGGEAPAAPVAAVADVKNAGDSPPKPREVKNPASETSEGSPNTPAAAKTIASDSLGGPLYLVLVSNSATQESYRLGTAWAAAPNQLVTTASVARALENEAFRERFPEASAWDVQAGKSHRIEQISMHPRYRELRRAADAEIEEYEQAADALNRLPAGDAARKAAESLRDEQFAKCTAALEKTLPFDAAAIRFSQPVAGQILELAGESTPLRPKLKLTVRGLAFDQEDPYFDPREATAPRELEGRVLDLPVAGGQEHLVVEANADHQGWNYLGSPIQSAGGQVVAMYARLAPRASSDERPNGAKLDAVPWFSIRELVEAK